MKKSNYNSFIRIAVTSCPLVVALAAASALAQSATNREEMMSRAQVWRPTDVAAQNLLLGDEGVVGAFAPFEPVECVFTPLEPGEKSSGATPKFKCRAVDGRKLKVKYGDDNGEVYAEVAASRLLRAIGFGADAEYSAQVTCRGCPADPFRQSGEIADRVYDPAAIEIKFDGKTIEEKDDQGWGWKELDVVNPSVGGAPRAHVDALRLLAAFIQHGDNKHQQQRLVCLDKKPLVDAAKRVIGCRKPFMLIQDLGATFGGAGKVTGPKSKMRLEEWSGNAIWRDDSGCRTRLSGAFFGGTMNNPVVGEEGRAFLANLLNQLSDRQIRDLFTASRAELRGSGTTDQWVAAFKHKVKQVNSRRCH